MEHQPPHPEDPDRGVPELERLYRGEIDLTGATQQDESLRDVIGDAISEADDPETPGGLPDWGARTMARALANKLDDPISGGLHHFAVTGRADKHAIAHDLAQVYNSTSDDEIRDWVGRLGGYVADLRVRAGPASQLKQGDLESPIEGSLLETLNAAFHMAFAEADARGEAVAIDDARALAAVLAAILGNSTSALARFADTGNASPAQLHAECQLLKRHRWRTEEVPTWIERFEQHLAARTDLGRLASGSAEPSANPVVERAIQQHGNALRAYLSLAHVDAGHAEVVRDFEAAFIGRFDSIGQLVKKLIDLDAAMASIQDAAEGWGLAGMISIDPRKLFAMVCENWNVVHHYGAFYVFTKQSPSAM